jgi:hypothetical protein
VLVFTSSHLFVTMFTSSHLFVTSGADAALVCVTAHIYTMIYRQEGLLRGAMLEDVARLAQVVATLLDET